jgi:hypothetical protein
MRLWGVASTLDLTTKITPDTFFIAIRFSPLITFAVVSYNVAVIEKR